MNKREEVLMNEGACKRMEWLKKRGRLRWADYMRQNLNENATICSFCKLVINLFTLLLEKSFAKCDDKLIMYLEIS